jgi:hypothetical protein
MRPAFEDKYLINNFKNLIKKHNLNRLFETGTWHGLSAKIASSHIPSVHSVEVKKEFFEIAKKNNVNSSNINLYFGTSPTIMSQILEQEDEGWIFFLDAHWKEDWPLLEELKVIASKKIKPVIMIHDFFVPDENNNAKFGFDTYEGQKLDLSYIKNALEEIYGENGYTYYYSTEVALNSGLIYIEPSTASIGLYTSAVLEKGV